MTCTHATSVAAVKALLNGRGVFGEQTSPVPPELGLIGGVVANMACLHRVKHGKPPTEFLNNSAAPKGHTQGQRAHPGSDLVPATPLRCARSPGWNNVNHARRGGRPSILPNTSIAELMPPTGKLSEQALLPDGRERTTSQPFLDILARLKKLEKSLIFGFKSQ